ncbi:MAG: hypothetical protein MN733_16450 [Nitrososphaera sp.]|nr:hypothetical protein [Nitrososphaera sp.]
MTDTSTLNPTWVIWVISLLSLAVSAFAYCYARRSRRSDVEHRLIQQRNAINDSFMKYEVKGPFAHLLKIPDEELKVYIPKAGLLFLQINLLEDVYQHQDILGEQRINAYTTWATKIVAPWIKCDKHLTEILKLIYATDDLMDKEFIVWLKSLIPIT